MLSICPECQEPVEEICYDCGCFVEKVELITTDFARRNARSPKGYEKRVHFKDVLNQFQGTDKFEIAEDMLEIIKQELPEDLEIVDVFWMRRLLKRLNLTEVITYAPSLVFKLTGKQPPYIKKCDEERLMRFFRQSVRVFNESKPLMRKNFINYNYVLYKLIELLKQRELLKHNPLLRKTRLKEHDKIWNMMCEKLDWEFIKTTL